MHSERKNFRSKKFLQLHDLSQSKRTVTIAVIHLGIEGETDPRPSGIFCFMIFQ